MTDRRKFLLGSMVGAGGAFLDRSRAFALSKRTLSSGKTASLAPIVERWGLQEIALYSPSRFKNPFEEVRLQAQFQSGDKVVLADGFYDGGQTWRIRVMPEVQGDWTFRTISNDAFLDGKSGSFSVGPPGKGNHGPVRVTKKYHFSYADGTPYFLLGTTLYNWLNRDADLEKRTLNSLATSAFTKVRFLIFPKWMIYNHIDPPSYPYVKREGFDFDTFEPSFFRHVEERLKDLQKLGIEADIILFHPYDKWGFARMDPRRDDAYIRYIAARFSAFRNVWWTMCNEYNEFQESVSGLKPKDWDRMFQVLQAADPYGHQKGMHNQSYSYDHAKPWITHAIAQAGPPRLIPLTSTLRQTYGKPAVVDEYGYEGNVGDDWGNLTAREVLERHWDVTMAGGYASHGETYVHPGGVLWWSSGGELVGGSPERLAFLREVMTSMPFQDLTPSPESVVGGDVLAKRGEYYFFRFKNFTCEAAQIKTEGSERFKVELIDPEQKKIYSLGYTTAGSQAFIPVVYPTLLRLTKVNQIEPGLPSGTLIELMATFIGDTTHPSVPQFPSWPGTCSAE